MLTEAIQNIILNNLMQKGTVNLNINCLVQNGIIKAGKSHYKWKEIKLVFFFSSLDQREINIHFNSFH